MSTGGTFENGIVSSGGADVGHRLVIVAGHGIVENVSNVKVDLASYVGAYLHANKVYTGPINLELTGVTLLESLSLKQVNELSGHRITALYNKPGYNKTPVILVGRTAAPITTPFTKISSIMVVNEFVNGLKNIADTYLGRPNSGTVRMSMQSTMQNFANSMKQAGKIAGAVVTVEPDVTSGTINALAVKARVQAFAEIEVISIDVTFEYQIA
jgi:energy-converting hydrogenase Eha subunit B